MTTGPPELFEPEARIKLVSLKLVMESSLTKSELDEYNDLPTEGALERARTLKTLHLEWQNIGEIAMLEPFEMADVLYMQYNRIERIEGLECLPNLQFLALQHNRIVKVENLTCLTVLECLDLSKNQIETLEENELPETINMLNLKENPCTVVPGYSERLSARLPDLGYLDGEEINSFAATTGGSTGAATDFNTASPELLAGEKGLSAYWRKDELQSAGEADIADRIEAYSIEALADVDGFSRQVEDASERSKVRRGKMEKSSRVGSSLREGQLANIMEEKEHFAQLIKEKEQLALRLKESAASGTKETHDATTAPVQ